jgi:hypothetical protein
MDIVKITLQLQRMIQQAPDCKLHNLSDTQLQAYTNLTKRKSMLLAQIEILMLHDGDL